MTRQLLNQAVRPIWVPIEVLRIARWVAAPVLGEEDAVRVIGPPWAGATHISRPKPLRQVTAAAGMTNVFDEPGAVPFAARAVCGRDSGLPAAVATARLRFGGDC